MSVHRLPNAVSPRVRVAAALLLPCAAYAAEAHEPGTVGAMLQSLLALGAVLVVILGAAWLLRRLQGGGVIANALVKTIASTAVGPRERVVLVEIQDTWLVLGVAQGSVRMLHSLPRGEKPDAATAGFATWLANARTRREL